MKKVIVTIIIIAIVVAVGIAGGVYFYNNREDEGETTSSSKKKDEKLTPKDFAENLCLTKESDINSVKEFTLKNMDCKAYLAYKLTHRGMSFEGITDYDSYKDRTIEYFNEQYEKITDEEVEETKKDVEDNFTDYFTVRDAKKLDVDSVGELKESYTFPAVEEAEVTYKDQDGKTYELIFYFYKDKFVGCFKKEGIKELENLMKTYFDSVEKQAQ